MSCGNDTALVEPELIGGLNPIFLGQQIIFGLIGIFTNSYSLYHILMKFNLSKILYKLLMAGSIINIVQFIANILAAIWLLLFTENEIVCIILTFTFIFPKLVLQFYMFEICIVRCISIYKTNYSIFQKSFIYFVSPLPFLYVPSVFVVQLGQHKPVGIVHSVSFLLTFHCLIFS